MRLLAAPTPAATTNQTVQGFDQFVNIGCAEGHIQHHTTAESIFTGQSDVQYTPFSDFALHNMGTGLQDRVSQGNANGQEFRTAPLWASANASSSCMTAAPAHRHCRPGAFELGLGGQTGDQQFQQALAKRPQAVIAFLRSL